MVAEYAVLFFQCFAHFCGNVAGANGQFQANFFEALRKGLRIITLGGAEDPAVSGGVGGVEQGEDNASIRATRAESDAQRSKQLFDELAINAIHDRTPS
ncbi:hypothetical protein D3C84_386030 [compost metagenome]